MTLEEQVAAWLAQNSHPLIILPKPRRTFGQWMNWLRAEGFLEADNTIPLGYGSLID